MFTTLLSTRVTAFAIAIQERLKADVLWQEAVDMNENPEGHDTDDIEEKFEIALSHYVLCERALGILLPHISPQELLDAKMPMGQMLVPLFDNFRVIADAYFDRGQYLDAFRNYYNFLEIYKKSLSLYPAFLSADHLNNLYFNYAQTLQNILSDADAVAANDPALLKSILSDCSMNIISTLITNRKYHSIKNNSQLAKRILDLIDSHAELHQAAKFSLSAIDERILIWSLVSILNEAQIQSLFTTQQVPLTSVEAILGLARPALTEDQQKNISELLADKNPQLESALPLARQKMHDRLQQFINNEEFKRQYLPVNKTLHPWQINSVGNLATILQNHTTAYFDVPTGAGKTLMFVFLANLVDEVTLIVVPTKQLCTQTKDRIAEYYPAAKNLVSIYNSDNRAIAISCRFLITTYDSMVQEIQNPPSARILCAMKPRLVILDEVHRALASTRVEMTQVLRNSAIVLGFSATVAYNLERRNGALASAATLLEHNAYTYARLDAMRDRIISQWHTVIIKLQAVYGTITKRKKLAQTKSEDHDYTAQELEKIVNTESYNHTALAIYANGIDPTTGKRFIGESSVVFCNSIKHVKAVTAVFNTLAKHPYFKDKGIIPAVGIHGGLSKKLITQFIQQHAEGKIAVLCGVKILLEGWDCPRVRLGFNLTPTKSELMLAQRGGRLIRWQPNKTAIIFEFDFGIEQCIFPNCEDIQANLIDAHPDNDPIALINTDKMTKFTVTRWGNQTLKAPLIRGASKEQFEPPAAAPPLAASSSAEASTSRSQPLFGEQTQFFANPTVSSDLGLDDDAFIQQLLAPDALQSDTDPFAFSAATYPWPR